MHPSNTFIDMIFPILTKIYKKSQFQQTTDLQTDTASYRDARTHLKEDLTDVNSQLAFFDGFEAFLSVNEIWIECCECFTPEFSHEMFLFRRFRIQTRIANFPNSVHS